MHEIGIYNLEANYESGSSVRRIYEDVVLNSIVTPNNFSLFFITSVPLPQSTQSAHSPFTLIFWQRYRWPAHHARQAV